MAETSEGGFTALKELPLKREKGEGIPSSLDKYALSRHRERGVLVDSGEKPLGGFDGKKNHHTCKREFLTIHCLKCGHQQPILTGSRDRTCPSCSFEMYSKIYEHYQEMVNSVPNLKFLTLTWKPVKKQDPKIIRDMGKALNKLLHRRRYAKLWKGKLATIECKKTLSGLFYYHIHCIVSGAYIPQNLISKDWREISGFPIVHVKRITRTPKRALRYILKYVLKGFTFNNEKDKHAFKASMCGVRYIRTYGDFYDFEYSTGQHVYFPCPNCRAIKSWVVVEFCGQVDLFEGVGVEPG